MHELNETAQTVNSRPSVCSTIGGEANEDVSVLALKCLYYSENPVILILTVLPSSFAPL